MAYNLSGISTNTTSIVDLLQGVNDILLFGWFGTITLVGLFFVMFMAYFFKTNNVNKSMTGSLFITAMLAMLIFRPLSLISDLVMFIIIILAGISLAFARRND